INSAIVPKTIKTAPIQRPLFHKVSRLGNFRLSASQPNQNNPAPKRINPSGITLAIVNRLSESLSSPADLTPPSVALPTENAYDPSTGCPSAETIFHFTVYVPCFKTGRENVKSGARSLFPSGFPVKTGLAFQS